MEPPKIIVKISKITGPKPPNRSKTNMAQLHFSDLEITRGSYLPHEEITAFAHLPLREALRMDAPERCRCRAGAAAITGPGNDRRTS